MKRTSRSTISISCLGLALLSQIGCKNELSLALSGNEPKVSLVVKKGDKITWKDTKARFKLVGPCAEGKETDTCTVNRDSGVFRYDCDGCEDPEIVVDSEGLKIPLRKAGAAAPRGFDVEVDIACLGTTIGIEPTKRTVKAEQVIKWITVGGEGEGLPTWDVTFTTSPCYDPQVAINQDQPLCKVKSTSGDYTYSVKSKSCTNGFDGTVSVIQ